LRFPTAVAMAERALFAEPHELQEADGDGYGYGGSHYGGQYDGQYGSSHDGHRRRSNHGNGGSGHVTGEHREHRAHRSRVWPEGSITTALGKARGLDSSREHDRLYRNTMQAMADGLILGRGRHGVVVALTNDPNDPRFSLAVKIVSKVFMPSGKGREGSFHRVVSHTLHVQNEVAANAKLSNDRFRTFVLPLYCALQDDTYVYLVMERACCSLQQLIKHVDDGEQRQLLAFQEEHPLKFLAFSTLTTAALLHACWTLQRSRVIHHDIHPAQILVTHDGRCAACQPPTRAARAARARGHVHAEPPTGRPHWAAPLGGPTPPRGPRVSVCAICSSHPCRSALALFPLLHASPLHATQAVRVRPRAVLRDPS
jgi:serine/threonine protein kinase